MKRRKIIVFVFSATLAFGCIAKKGVPISENRVFPREPAFTIMPVNGYSNVGIDYNSVYCVRFESIGKNNKVSVSYNYYRFWPNGRVLIKSSEYLPTKESVESFEGAYLGYYKVNGRNLVMEFFIPDSGIMDWDYIRTYALIGKDQIIELRSEIRGEREPGEGEVFIKLHLGELVRKPDW